MLLPYGDTVRILLGIPYDLAQRLAEQRQDLSCVALEAPALDAYRIQRK